ncbi:hypothetical protein ABGV42_00600 [Paenibacillus pabuli]|uniref:hypothetical protein n=1 Tax=Paenibacillus pabuli TaxID=1472 RepID=UPI003242979E
MDRDQEGYYDNLVASLGFSDVEQYNYDLIKNGLAYDEDIQRSDRPWDKVWGPKFFELNPTGITFEDAPLSTFIVVISPILGSVYSGVFGTKIGRGSIFIKLSEELIYLVDGWYWGSDYFGPTRTSGQRGYFNVYSHRLKRSLQDGKDVKMLADIINP